MTGAQLDKKASQFLLNVIQIRESAYAKFRKDRLEEKSVQLFDSIPKTIEYHQSYLPKRKNIYIKRNNSLMRNIDYARIRDYSISNLLKYEITSASFCLTKGGFLRKHKKSKLDNVTKEPFKNECLSEVAMRNKKAMLVVNLHMIIQEQILFLIYTQPTVSRKQNGTEEMPWKELAQICLDHNNNFLLTQKNFGQLVKIK